ncbi:hypothetical protein BGW36DRAFT_372163 [Talaromyces proteolyticus]|uniref:Uncharacterized protein n=1 Tax=Talaromyces proteolyticus TaxID=1131652 RepID=A0AAD4Q3T9_9EURO|nr:uncharacterized protein BGW36DRAFT_372163 [Talaromyces proteolyticus]KAH8702081.1 hypothetical protein BGW36DRAFT_372163 [Talaromyces proteolyticus]
MLTMRCFIRVSVLVRVLRVDFAMTAYKSFLIIGTTFILFSSLSYPSHLGFDVDWADSLNTILPRRGAILVHMYIKYLSQRISDMKNWIIHDMKTLQNCIIEKRRESRRLIIHNKNDEHGWCNLSTNISWYCWSHTLAKDKIGRQITGSLRKKQNIGFFACCWSSFLVYLGSGVY